MTRVTSDREGLLDLCHALGDPARDLVLSAEGNVSLRTDAEGMLIKASGCSLRTMTADDLVDVDRTTLLTLLDDPVDDARTAATYRAAVRAATERAPSVEAILHAVLYDLTPARVIAHTHPTAVNALACSSRADLLVQGSLFPDAVVVLGRRQVLVPYTDPGVPLARAVRDAVVEATAQEGVPPRVVYLANHGLFVVAGSAAEALQLTEMATKNARILQGTLAAGGPRFLGAEHVDRIDRRPDEAYRRRAMGVD